MVNSLSENPLWKRTQRYFTHPTHIRKRLGTLMVVLGVSLLGSIYLLNARLHSPEHRMQQFERVIEGKDPASLLALADEPELQHVNMTPEKYQAMLRELVASPNGLQFGQMRVEPMNERQRRYHRAMQVALLDGNGKPLAGPDGNASVYLEAYNTDRGWKISASKFLHSLHLARYQASGLHYEDFCARYGVPFEIYEPADGRWHPLTSAVRR